MESVSKHESQKDSGVEWLGKIPSAWEVKRNIGLFDERKEVNRPDLQLLSVTINKGVLKQEDSTAKKDSSNDDKSKYKVVRVGDLVYNKMRMWQGAIGASEYDGIVSPAYIVLKPRDPLYSRYYHYLFRTGAFIEEANRHSYGLCLDMNSLRYEDFKTLYSPVPARGEVERIVRFIERSSTDMDLQIAKKQRLIELLQEQRDLLITGAITHGLNPNKSTLNGGTETNDVVPAHWQVKRIKFCSKIFRGKFTHRPRNDPRLYDGKFPFIQTGDVARAGKFITQYTQSLNEKGLRVSTLVPKGTIVISIAANIGDTAILGFDACFPDSVVGFLPNKEVNQDFFYYLLSSMKQKFMASSIQNAQMNLNVERIGSHVVSVPPLEEQKEIVCFLEKSTSLIDSYIEEANAEIAKLYELKALVISKIVLGAIKV